MALTVQHLNSDASFLLSFEPIVPDYLRNSGIVPQPFTILLDPWITGPSKIFHSRISISTHKHPACIASLAQLPEPDLVIVSQHKSDHCNEATLRQLPPTGTKTLILAEPTSARVIRGWKYFSRDKVRTIERWEDPRLTGKTTAIRVPVPALTAGGPPGEVTVAWIPQKRDLAGLKGAIGITYRPPPTRASLTGKRPPPLLLPTPPTTPPGGRPPALTLAPPGAAAAAPFGPAFAAANTSTTDARLPPSPPISPRSLRSVQSASTLQPSPTNPVHLPILARATTARLSQPPGHAAPSHLYPHHSRPLSLLFSPHGISYANLMPYATSHLVSEAALPLTALLHCMDSISNPWWLGGNICAGMPAGAEIARRLYARVWISAHDGEKDVRGLATGLLRTRRYRKEEVEEVVSPCRESFADGDAPGGRPRAGSSCGGGGGSGGCKSRTDIFRLASGDEVVVSSDGMVFSGADNFVSEEEKGRRRKTEDSFSGMIRIGHEMTASSRA